jgi:phosphatidylglycerol---prolipoprotein diacylglyceryl transferase
MHPVLFNVGPFTVHTYGALIALAFLVGLLLAAKEAKRKGIDPERMMDLGLYILIAAIVGSRLFQVAVEHKYFFQNPLEIVKIWKGGLAFYGGFIGALFMGIWYLRKHGLPVWKVGDALAPSIAIGQAIGRLGCLSAGCCYGLPTDLPWGITFNAPGTLALPGIPLQPTQLYESFCMFILFGVLWAFRKRITVEGQLFWTYVMSYSVIRFIIEFFRGDTERGFIQMGSFDLSSSQAVAIFAFMTAVVALTALRAQARKKANAGQEG